MSQAFFNLFPKHLQIRDILRRRIESELQAGDQMPTEKELSEQFGVSRETIREALRWLQQEGLITRHRGQGTFVAKRAKPGSDSRVTGLTEDLYRLKQDTEWTVLEKGFSTAPRHIASRMNVLGDEPIYRIVRLQLYDKKPLAYHESYLPPEYGVPIAKLDLSHTSIAHELQDKLGVPVQEDHQQLDAVIADTFLAATLGVPLGAPLLLMTRLFVEKNGNPAVVFRTHYRADRYYYTVKLPESSKVSRTKTTAQRPRRSTRKK